MAADAHQQLEPDDVTRVRLAVMRLARRLRQQASGITQSQLSALSSIEREGPLTIGNLADIENVQPPTISRIVGALEGEGWVERVAHEHDGRIALVQVTRRGRRELERIRSDSDAWLARRLATLAPGDRRKVVAALPALEHLLDGAP